MRDPLQQVPNPAAGTLFDNTSRLAGEVAAMFVGSRYVKILNYLQDRGPAAIFEIAAHLGVYDHQISGRFGELERDGWIEKTGERKTKPETGCRAEIYRIRQQAANSPDVIDRLGYPATLKIGDELFDRAPIVPGNDAPGIPYARRADAGAGGVRLNYRVEIIECGGCGRPLKLVIEKTADQNQKLYRCGNPSCNRTWHLHLVQTPGQPQILAMVLKTL